MGGFLRQEWVVWVLDGFAVGLFFVLALAYHVPMEVPVYTVVLLQTGMVVLEAFRYGNYCERRRMLRENVKLSGTEDAPIGEMPEARFEAEKLYCDIVRNLERRCVSREQEFRDKLEKADRYYTRWSHQIKTPIAGMRLLLQEEEIDRVSMERELFRISQYVESVLQYQRLQATGNDLVIREYSVEDMVRQALKRMTSLFVGKKVSVHLGELGYQVITDEKWFVFVLEQLISNAVKYTRKGQISIYMEEGIRRVLVIEDTGMGIREEDLPRIFEWGYTGNNGRVDKKATGIGLALCKETLDMLGHQIHVESKQGEGTKVFLDLTQKRLEDV